MSTPGLLQTYTYWVWFSISTYLVWLRLQTYRQHQIAILNQLEAAVYKSFVQVEHQALLTLRLGRTQNDLLVRKLGLEDLAKALSEKFLTWDSRLVSLRLAGPGSQEQLLDCRFGSYFGLSSLWGLASDLCGAPYSSLLEPLLSYFCFLSQSVINIEVNLISKHAVVDEFCHYKLRML